MPDKQFTMYAVEGAEMGVAARGRQFGYVCVCMCEWVCVCASFVFLLNLK